MIRPFIRLVLATAGLALAAGCDSSQNEDAESTAPVVQLGGPGETNRVLSDDEVAEPPAVPAHTDADVAFVEAMIAHHQQALEMTALVEAQAARPDLSLLAERIEVTQVAEIDQLQQWLTQRGEDPQGYERHGAMVMPGMLTADQLARLADVSGQEFDVLFLQAMIHHHEGALVMVEQLLTGGRGGQEPEIFQLAQAMASDQAVEIARMKAVLVELAAGD